MRAVHRRAPSTLTYSSPADISNRLKRIWRRSLFATVKRQIECRRTKELEYARLKIQLLEESLRLRRIDKYGPGREKLSSCNWSCWNRAWGQQRGSDCRERASRLLPPIPEAKKKRQAPWPPDSARRSAARGAGDRLHAGTVYMRNCGAETKVIGYEVSEVLE